MDPHRKHWNQQQKALRIALTKGVDHQAAIELFMDQHAMLHAPEMASSGLHSFEAEIWADLPTEHARLIPRGYEHSIAWIFWHLERIEDVTMNVLVAGRPQLLREEGWLERMGVIECDTGNAMDAQRVADLSARIDIDALRAYRLAVGRSTREIVRRLSPDDLKQKVDPHRLQRLLDEGAVEPAAMGLIEYWGGLTVDGLLLMPPTRHNFVHLNEALRLKQKCL